MEAVALGRYQFFELECRVVRRNDGVHCYVRVPFGHELYGRSAREIDLVLETPRPISYSAGGAHGWFIGAGRLESWEIAVDCCEAVARELAAFEAPELWSAPRPARRSGIRPRALTEEAPGVVEDVA